jgi:hypothetical protein
MFRFLVATLATIALLLPLSAQSQSLIDDARVIVKLRADSALVVAKAATESAARVSAPGRSPSGPVSRCARVRRSRSACRSSSRGHVVSGARRAAVAGKRRGIRGAR